MAGDLWIESHAELKDHPKLARLSKSLKVKPVVAVGHLHCLWWWAARYADDGDTSAWSAEDIATGAEWAGDAGFFSQALRHAGFMEENGQLHDWDLYFSCNRRREKDRERKALYRASHKDVPRMSRGQKRMSRGCPSLPDQTRPDQTGPDQTNTSQASATAPADVAVDKVPDPAKNLLGHHCANYVKRVGEQYPVSGQKDMALCRKLISTYGLPRACELSDQMFRSFDDFVKSSGYTFGAFWGCAAKLAAEYHKDHPKPRTDAPRPYAAPTVVEPPRLTAEQNAEKARLIREVIEAAKPKVLPS